MLKRVKKSSNKAAGRSFAIIASQYNSKYVDAMLAAAEEELTHAEAARVEIFRVPGAYEIPLVAAALARLSDPNRTAPRRGPRVDAILCLGVILRGQTVHAAHIGEAVSRALMEIQVRHEVPVIHEVLLLENEEQARVRCCDPDHNRGTEAAQSAVIMAAVCESLAVFKTHLPARKRLN